MLMHDYIVQKNTTISSDMGRRNLSVSAGTVIWCPPMLVHDSVLQTSDGRVFYAIPGGGVWVEPAVFRATKSEDA
ncbi:MAG: hypothetical protein ACRDIC_19725 [bacterium]